MTYLGEKIKRHRQEKGYSLGKLAELTDTSKSYLWEIETRDTCKPSGEKLARIAEALSVTTDYLLDEAAEPGNEVLREAFFRKFNKLEEEDQKKIEQMVDLWGRKDTEYISGAAKIQEVLMNHTNESAYMLAIIDTARSAMTKGTAPQQACDVLLDAAAFIAEHHGIPLDLCLERFNEAHESFVAIGKLEAAVGYLEN